MLRRLAAVALAALVAETLAECNGAECSDPVVKEGDAGSLLQVKQRSRCSSQPHDPNSAWAPCPDDKQVLIFGTPLASYHNATARVYKKALEQNMTGLGYEVILIWKYVHPILYPMFTGFGGVDKGLCKEVGCADKCREEGLGDTSPCIDFVVDSNIPVNHAEWIEPYQSQYDVIGTSFEKQFITLWAPRYAKFTNISQAAADPDVYKSIIGFNSGPGDNCDTLYCPKCGGGQLPFITGPPLSTAGFNFTGFPCPEYPKVIKSLINQRKKFLTLTWTPQVWPAAFPLLEPVGIEQYTPQFFPNEGKALIRTASKWKFSDKAYAVLGAVYIGTEGAQQMDAWSHGYNNNPPGNLCPYYSFNTACSEEAADKWISLNKDIGDVQGVWKTFFW